MSARRHLPPALLLVLACALAALPAGAATSSTVVGATVPSATDVDPGSCPPGVFDTTSFGALAAGASKVTQTDCTILFGSSNDTAQLRIAQQDGRGVGMYRTITGATDPSFAGGAGSLAIAGTSASDSSANATHGGVGIQSTGAIIVAGSSGTDILVHRLDAAGAPDATFGTSGIATISRCASATVADIAVMPDDRIVLVGNHNCGTTELWVARLTASGTPDGTFGAAGLASHPYSNDVRALSVRDDGAIVVAGGGGTYDLVRITAAGSTETTFGGGDGHVNLGIGGGGALRGVELLDDGRVVASGYRDPGGGDRPLVVRTTATGAFDLTFGGGDGWEQGNAGTFEGRSMTIDRTGRIWVAAYEGVARFTSAGLADSTFDGDGTLDLRSLRATSVFHHALVQPDGFVVLVGRDAGSTMLFARVGDAGIDGTFGTNGFVTVDPPGSGNGANWATWTEDGELVAIGPGGSGLSVARLQTVSMPDHASGVQDWSSGTGMFAVCLRATSAGATATWPSDGTCQLGNGTDWNDLPAAAEQVARTTVGNTEDAAAHLRFGLRTGASQASGAYVAPIAFSVLAPS